MAFDRLIRAIDEKKNPTVAGLDPKLDYVPEFIKKDSRRRTKGRRRVKTFRIYVVASDKGDFCRQFICKAGLKYGFHV